MVRKLFFLVLRLSCIPFLIREVFQKNKVTILLYHNIKKDLFKRHVQVLQGAYNLVGLQDYIKACKDSNYKLPPKALVITFDDGHKSNYLLLDIIQKLNIPITIFLCSSIVDTQRKYWFNIKVDEYDVQRLKDFSTEERLSLLKQYGFEEKKSFPDREALNKEEIMAMKEYVDFQSHSCLHPCLTQCTDARAEEEIVRSKEELEKNFALKVNAFSYPNGDYSDRDIKVLKAAGYEVAVTVDHYFNDENSAPYTLKRLSIWDTVDQNEVIVRASGLWTFLKNCVISKKYGYKKLTR